MNAKDIPMVPNRKASLPRVYGDTPSFLGTPVVTPDTLTGGCDVVVAGVPWEGTVTWGSFSGCELAPRTIRHASARYGGFLPEYNTNLFDYLTVSDIGDISVTPADPGETMQNVHAVMSRIYQNGSIPMVFGGDHSFTPEIVRALSDSDDGDIGIIHFDAHLDNAKEFGEDKFPRCGPIHRIAQLKKVRNDRIVHLGIRGPRNSQTQYEYAQSMGARIITAKEIRERGMAAVTDEAIAIAHRDTKHVFVTICSDCIDAGYNPGGPADFNGLFPNELLPALHKIARSGISGIDYVEVYPGQDPQGYSSHLAAWAMIYALVGLATRKRDAGK
jgi:guanidinopropionase